MFCVRQSSVRGCRVSFVFVYLIKCVKCSPVPASFFPYISTSLHCAQQFSAAQKQTEAIKHIMRRRKPAAASTPAAAPQPARRRGRPLWPPPLPRRGSSHSLWSRSQTGRPARPGPRQTRRQAQVQEALRRATQRWRELLVGRW